MQIFKNIDLKKNSTFFSQSCSAMFLAQTVHGCVQKKVYAYFSAARKHDLPYASSVSSSVSYTYGIY